MQSILYPVKALCPSLRSKFGVFRQLSEWANVIPSEISESKPAKVQNLGKMLDISGINDLVNAQA